MKRTGDETCIFESTGRTLSVFEGIIGLSLDGQQGPTAGHDCDAYVPSPGHPDLLPSERVELADYMIALWQEYKAQAQGA